jgi:hypothetical protein
MVPRAAPATHAQQRNAGLPRPVLCNARPSQLAPAAPHNHRSRRGRAPRARARSDSAERASIIVRADTIGDTILQFPRLACWDLD